MNRKLVFGKKPDFEKETLVRGKIIVICPICWFEKIKGEKCTRCFQ